MEYQIEHIHSLAIRYFEGRITLSEEKELFLFVNADSANHRIFRKWEKEWMVSAVPQLHIEKEWKQICRRKQVRNVISVNFKERRYPLRRMIAAAAVIAVLLLGGVYGLFSYFEHQTPVSYYALVTDFGEKSKITLTDGTTVWLNAGSSLRYGDNFNDRNREVILDGEAYFEVERKSEGTPFSVKTANYNVVVKGTKFNVTSYQDDLSSTITLLEGAVDIVYEGRKISVKPGESFNFNKENREFLRHEVQADQYKSWIKGKVEYDEITLNELAVRLSRKYNIRIHLDDIPDKEVTFRVSLRNEETIDEVMYALSEIIPIQYERYDREIYIKKQ